MAVPCCVVLLVVVTLVTGDATPPVVQTSAGAIRGVHLASFSGRQYAAFRGIPYASPPVGELRFSPPEPAAPWPHELDATRYGANCLQYNMMHMSAVEGEEDCLFVNVFSPRLPQTDVGEGLPVLLWIHGGGFVSGSGDDDLHGMDYLMDEDVVVVTINYRLGVFGFYTTEDAAAPGNMGLRDQQLAMRWVQQNIGKFGGDRRRVALFGESAGGASVSLQVLSPLGAGTFQRAISQSGAATAAWSLGSPQRPLVKELVEKFGCGDDNTSWLSCLRRVDSGKLLEACHATSEGFHTQFHPRVDGSDSDAPVLPEQPNILLERGKFNQVPRIIGQVSHESAIMAGFYHGIDWMMQRLHEQDLEVWGSAALLGGGGIFDKTDQPLQVAAAIRERMLSDGGGDLTGALVSLMDARFFTLSIESEANLTSLHVPVYKYVVDETGPGQMRFGDVLAAWKFPGMPEDVPPAHADDIAYLFRGREQKAVLKDSPKHRMIQIFTRLWTSFARLGYPSVEGLPAWPLFTERSKRHLRLNLAPSVGSHAFVDTMRFWRSLPLKESWNAELWTAESASGSAAHEEL